MAQPLDKQVGVTSDGNGNATFTFQNPPTGFWWTGTLNCASAPIGSIFTATIGATQWGQWGGNSVYGPVQAQANRQLTVTATGLAPSTSYVLSWLGQEQSSIEAEILYPAANSTALQTQIQNASASVIYPTTLGPATSSLVVTINVPINTRTLYINASPLLSAVSNILVQGGNTTYPYFNDPAYLQSTAYSTEYFFAVVPYAGIVDNTCVITITTPVVTVTNLTVWADSVETPESYFYNGQATTSSIARTAAGTYNLVTGPARILSATLDVDGAEGYTTWGSQRMMHIVSSGATNNGITQAFPENTLLPAGVAINAVLTAAGAINASVTWAYP